MKLHDLRPAPGSHTARTRVGRGIAAGKGKTAGRGTKGQKARAGGSIPPWFEGGQTPLHMRIPKLRGFKNRFKVEYEVVNVGDIAAVAARGGFEGGEPAGGTKARKAAPATVNQDLLRAVGLVRTLKKPLKILGNGELSTPLFVVADAFTKSAVSKIEAAGGTVSILETPRASVPAIGVDDGVPAPTTGDDSAVQPARGARSGGPAATAKMTEVGETEPVPAEDAAGEPAKPARRTSQARTQASDAPAEPSADEGVSPDTAAAEPDTTDASAATDDATGEAASPDEPA
jgi:large subunit ribosomal protein L15